MKNQKKSFNPDKSHFIESEDGKHMIPANRSARRIAQKIKGGQLPRPIKMPTVKMNEKD